jgi:hypothetical protein
MHEEIDWAMLTEQEFGSDGAGEPKTMRLSITLLLRVARIIAYHPRFAEARDFSTKVSFDFSKATREALTYWILWHEATMEVKDDGALTALRSEANSKEWSKYVTGLNVADIPEDRLYRNMARLERIAEEGDTQSLRDTAQNLLLAVLSRITV